MADVLRVVVLGSGTPRPDINRFSQSILVETGERKLLFDAGRGATIRLSQAGINIADIDRVFLTHLHSDHILGLPDILMTGWIYRRHSPLEIFGPIGTNEFISNVKEAFDEDISIRTVPPESHKIDGLNTKIYEINEGLVFEDDVFRVIAFRVDHGGGVKDSFGYKIHYKDKVVIISGDTNYSENLIKYAKNCDLLIHEIADAPDSLISQNDKVRGLMNYHTTPSEMIKIIEKVMPKYTVLTHILALGGTTPESILEKINNSVEQDYKVEMAYDLMAIDVKDEIVTYKIDYTYD